jgi:acyl transferase domain-containing protein
MEDLHGKLAVMNDSQDALNIDDPTIAQPLCTALQIGIVKLLEVWGVKPAVTIGHSSGMYNPSCEVTI